MPIINSACRWGFGWIKQKGIGCNQVTARKCDQKEIGNKNETKKKTIYSAQKLPSPRAESS